MVCKRAALAWTAGSDTQRAEGTRRGSSVSSVSSLTTTTNRSLGWETKMVPGSERSEYGWKCGPRGSIEAYKGMLAISEEKLDIASRVRFHSWRPYKLLHASWVQTSTRGANVIARCEDWISQSNHLSVSYWTTSYHQRGNCGERD